MAIVINGSGTVTGISVGGLPDDIVDSGTLASDALDSAVTINDSGADVDFRVEGSGEANALFVQGSDGNVGIGTDSPTTWKFDVRRADNDPVFGCTAPTSYTKTLATFQGDTDTADGTWEIMQGRNGGGRVMFMYDSGNIVNSNNSYGSLSDERIKQDIADASSQWEDIKALKIRKFKLKKAVNKDGAENTLYQIGVIAQEVEDAGMSGLVQEGKPSKEDVALHSDFGTIDGDGLFTEGEKIKEIKYSVLYMKAIKALQEAMDRIETLETKVTALENV